MSELDEQESEFSRLLSRTSFDESARGEHRDALRERALAHFESAEFTAPLARWKSALNKGRTLMRRPIVRYTAFAAACLTVAAIWLLVPGQQSTAEAFNKFAEAIVEAKTARFQMELEMTGQPKRKFKAYYLAPGRFRHEVENVVGIMDMKVGKIVTLNPEKKTAIVMNLKGRQESKPASSMDVFEQLRELLSKRGDTNDRQYQRLGEKEIGGQPAVGFRRDSPEGTITLWGNPATGQPVRVEIIFSGVPRTEVAMTDFELNVELQESLFDLTPPADYKVQSFDIDASPPTEADLVSALRITSDMAGGKYPDTLDTASIMKAMSDYITEEEKENKENSDEQTKQLMQKSMTIGRGWGFALQLPESADAHYAGKDVTRDAKDTPIFWYMPEGKKKYQVIYADLSTREVDQAPQVPGAVRIEKTGKANPSAEK